MPRAPGRDTPEGRRAYNEYMRMYMRRRYRRLKLEQGRKRFWSPEAIEWLHHAYPNQSAVSLALAMGRNVQSLHAKATALGIRKSKEFRREEGRKNTQHPAAVAARFKKGRAPANKGLRRPGWHRGRMKETQFRKGVVNGMAAKHLMPIGATRLVDGYIYVKVAAVQNVAYTVNWKPLHVLNWERANGRPMPVGHCLLFRDGNRQNVELANLELLSRADNMRRNTVHNLPKALKEVVQLRGAIVRQINRREGNGKRREEDQQHRGPSGPAVRHAAGSARQGKADGDRPRKGRGRGRPRAGE